MRDNKGEQKDLQRAALVMVLLNAFATPLMLSSVNVALPAIAASFKLNAVMLSWIPMAYLMASAVFVLIFGRLADMYGRKRIFLLGTSLVIATSLLAALSNSGELLIIARFLQGMSAAMLYATQVAIVSSVFPPDRRGHAIGITVAAIYLGLTCGPAIGGYLIDQFGWRACFIFHIPLAVIVLLIGILKVPGDWSAEEPGRFDLKGALIYAFSITAFCLGVSSLPGNISFIYIAFAIIGAWVFFHMAHRSAYPILDVTLFYTNRVFTLSCLASFIVYTATFANVVLVSLFLQYLKGISATTAGVIMMTQPLVMTLVSPFTGRLSDRIEPRVIASSGVAMIAFGLTMLALMTQSSPLTVLIVALVMTGLGISLFTSPNANAIMGSVEKRNYGSATGSLATMRILGQASSMALVTLIFAVIIGTVEITPANYQQLERAITVVLMVAAGLCLPGMYFSMTRGKIHQ